MRFRRGRARREAGNAADEVDRAYVLAGFIVVVGALVAFGNLLDSANIDVWTGILTALVLLVVSVPIFLHVARVDEWPRMVTWLVVALILKFLFGLVRYWFIFRLNGGQGDAGVYLEAGGMFAQRMRLGIPIHPLGRISYFPRESQFIGDITGVIYYLTGSSRYAAFMIFSWGCFMGELLMVQALRVAVPEADIRRYAISVLFLPSLLFWPSSVGKEAVMVLLLGLIFYGAARLLAPQSSLVGLVPLALGIGAALLIRPHIAAMAIGSLAAALGVAFLRSSPSTGGGALARLLRLAVLLGLLAMSGFVLTRVGEAVSGTGSSAEALSASEQLAKAAEQTSIGNSAFQPIEVSNPIELPIALVTVLFRPFPWEASSAGGLIAAAESAVLTVLFLLSWRRVLSFPLLATRRTYLILVLGFVLAFSVGFSYIGNFGILARQRVQMLPAVLVFFALPVRPRKGEQVDPGAGDSTDAADNPRPIVRFAARPPAPLPSNSRSSVARRTLGMSP